MFEVVCICNRVLAGIRTLGPLIKSQLLYQLSYEDNLSRKPLGFSSGKSTIFLSNSQYFFRFSVKIK